MSKPSLAVTAGLLLITAILASAPMWAGRGDLRLIGEIRIRYFVPSFAVLVYGLLLTGSNSGFAGAEPE